MTAHDSFCDIGGDHDGPCVSADERDSQVEQEPAPYDPFDLPSLERDGTVVVIQSYNDPGDLGEPREWVTDGRTYLVVPHFDTWGWLPSNVPDLANATLLQRIEGAIEEAGGEAEGEQVTGELLLRCLLANGIHVSIDLAHPAQVPSR